MKTPDDFGAVAGTDESAAVQAWANAGGGAWPRAYRIDAPVGFPDGMVLKGDVEASTLAIGAAAPDATMLWINAGCQIDGLRVDGSAYAKPSNNNLIWLQGQKASALSHFEIVNTQHTFALAQVGGEHELTDVVMDGIVRGVYYGNAGGHHSRMTFRNTKASPYQMANVDALIEDVIAEDLGENFLMANIANRDCTLRRLKLRRVRRDPVNGDNGTGIELHGEGWTLEDIDAQDIDWSVITAFDPVGLRILGRIDLRNPGQCAYPEWGNDSSACISLYMINPALRPRDVVIRDALLTDYAQGRSNAVRIMGSPGSRQITDLHIVGGAMPGAWKGGQAIDVRNADTGGVRPVCGERCYSGNTPLGIKGPAKQPVAA